jgi:hypothetical protein
MPKEFLGTQRCPKGIFRNYCHPERGNLVPGPFQRSKYKKQIKGWQALMGYCPVQGFRTGVKVKTYGTGEA